MNAAELSNAPGPKSYWPFGILREFQQDPISMLLDSHREFLRDPNEFYREYGDEPTEEWGLNCDEFRHGDIERCELGIIIPDHWQGTNAALVITMTARNMSNPATKTIPLRIDTIPRDTTSMARTLLDELLK